MSAVPDVGVSWNKSVGKWSAKVWDGKKYHHLGVYDKECDVVEVVWKAKEDLEEIQAVHAAAVGRQGVGRAAQERDSSRRFSVCERERKREGSSHDVCC